MNTDAFELIDLKSGNVASDYVRRDEALAALYAVAVEHGWTAIANFSLMRIRGDDQKLVAKQARLVQLVKQSRRPKILAAGDRPVVRSQARQRRVAGRGHVFAVHNSTVREGRRGTERRKAASQPARAPDD